MQLPEVKARFEPQGAIMVTTSLERFNQVIKDDAAPLRVHGMALNEAGDQAFAAGHGKVLLWTMQA